MGWTLPTSAGDAGRAFDLRCEIREKLLAWIRDRHPEALPVTRLSTAERGTLEPLEMLARASG